jgi:hypothetical protein
MKKISLYEAREMLADIVLVDVFASLVTQSLEEDYKDLKLLKHLTDKIYQAEKYFNINDIIHQIDLLKFEEIYYQPSNAVFYYKEAITEEIKESNFDIYSEIQKNIQVLEEKLEEISKHVHIEVNI